MTEAQIAMIRHEIAGLHSIIEAKDELIKRLQSKGIEVMHFEISELKAELAASKADLLASQAEANGLRLRVAGLLIEIEDLSNE